MNRPVLDQKLKERFFALYWGQSVVMCSDDMDFNTPYPAAVNGFDGMMYLRSIDSLTDEEAIQVAKMDFISVNYLFEQAGIELRWSNLSSHITDYLRSISIALPFCGYSVEELQDAGFLRLKEKEA